MWPKQTQALCPGLKIPPYKYNCCSMESKVVLYCVQYESNQFNHLHPSEPLPFLTFDLLG